MQLNCMEYPSNQPNWKDWELRRCYFCPESLELWRTSIIYARIHTVQSLYKSISHHWNSEESEMTKCLQDFKLSGPNLIQSIDLEEVVIPYAKKPQSIWCSYENIVIIYILYMSVWWHFLSNARIHNPHKCTELSLFICANAWI